MSGQKERKEPNCWTLSHTRTPCSEVEKVKVWVCPRCHKEHVLTASKGTQADFLFEPSWRQRYWTPFLTCSKQ